MTADADSADGVNKLDELFHAKARLGIMAVLNTRGEADFTSLKRELGLTDGNLGAHLRALEDAGYAEVEKQFVDRKPRTTLRPTRKGRAAFERYLTQLESVIRSARRPRRTD